MKAKFAKTKDKFIIKIKIKVNLQKKKLKYLIDYSFLEKFTIFLLEFIH